MKCVIEKDVPTFTLKLQLSENVSGLSAHRAWPNMRHVCSQSGVMVYSDGITTFFISAADNSLLYCAGEGSADLCAFPSRPRVDPPSVDMCASAPLELQWHPAVHKQDWRQMPEKGTPVLAVMRAPEGLSPIDGIFVAGAWWYAFGTVTPDGNISISCAVDSYMWDMFHMVPWSYATIQEART